MRLWTSMLAAAGACCAAVAPAMAGPPSAAQLSEIQALFGYDRVFAAFFDRMAADVADNLAATLARRDERAQRHQSDQVGGDAEDVLRDPVDCVTKLIHDAPHLRLWPHRTRHCL